MRAPGRRSDYPGISHGILSWGVIAQCIRWLAVVPTAILAWHMALLVGLALYSGLEALCPAEQKVSEICIAVWFASAESGVFIFSAAFAAALIVTSCTLIAPDHRRVVAWTTFALGTLAAAYLALETMAIWEFVAAVVAGSISAWLLSRREAKVG